MSKYKGKLDVFSEQGCGHAYSISVYGKSGYDSLYIFSKHKKYIAKIFNEEKEVVYSGSITYSRSKTLKNNYFFTPKEITLGLWNNYVNRGLDIILEEEIIDMEDSIVKSLLDTDLYKLTMCQFSYDQGKRANAEYQLICRSGEDLRPYKEEIESQIDKFKNLSFKKDEIEYLESLGLFSSEFLSFLEFIDLKKISVKIKDNEENLKITVKGPWNISILFEVPLLAIVQEVYFKNTGKKEDLKLGLENLDKKLKLIEDRDLPFMDFGTRRRYSFEMHEEVLKRLIKNKNLIGTSNVFLAKKYGIKPIGTMAHEYFQAMQVLGSSFETSQKEALYLWRKQYGNKLSVALTDTLTTNVFLADCDKNLTDLYEGYRHDSGDPIEWGYKMLAHFHEKSVDPKSKKLIYSDGLNFEKAIEIYDEFKDKTNVSFGIGTNLTNDIPGNKAISLVMKLVKMNNKPTIKVSDNPVKIMSLSEDLKKSTFEYIKKASRYPRINVAVDGIIEKDNKVLLIKRANRDEAGFEQWALPGGYLDYFETASEAVEREIKEETGLDSKVSKLIQVLDNPNRDPRGRIVSLVFKLNIEDFDFKLNDDEVSKVIWASKEDLKTLNIAFDHRKVIKDYFNK